MTYAEAQMLIDDSNRQDEVPKSLRNLNNLAKKLKQKRLNAGYNNLTRYHSVIVFLCVLDFSRLYRTLVGCIGGGASL